MPQAWAVAAWVTCGLVLSLGPATIGLAVAGRVPSRQFVTGFMALGPLFGMPDFALGPYLLLLFPDGRLPGRRWRPAAWAGGAAMAALVAASAVLAWPVRRAAARGRPDDAATMVWLWLRPRAGSSYLGRMRTG
jgi:hypothetical protein